MEDRQRGEGDVSLEFSGKMEENRGGSEQRLCPAGPAKHLGIILRGFYLFLLSRVFQRNACSRSKGNVVLSKPGVLSRLLHPSPPSSPFPRQRPLPEAVFLHRELHRLHLLRALLQLPPAPLHALQELQGPAQEVQQLYQVALIQFSAVWLTRSPSGPLLPRVTDCLSARQQLAGAPRPGDPSEEEVDSCPTGCVPRNLCTVGWEGNMGGRRDVCRGQGRGPSC